MMIAMVMPRNRNVDVIVSKKSLWPVLADQRPAALTPACFLFSNGTDSRKRMAQRHYRGNYARQSQARCNTNNTKPTQAIIQLTSDTPRLHQHVSLSLVAQTHLNTHFPPRPHQSARHSHITDVLSPRHVSQTKCKQATPHHHNHPAHQRDTPH